MGRVIMKYFKLYSSEKGLYAQTKLAEEERMLGKCIIFAESKLYCALCVIARNSTEGK
jgi:hypothetical protein